MTGRGQEPEHGSLEKTSVQHEGRVSLRERTHSAEDPSHLKNEVKLSSARDLAGTLGGLQGLQLQL